MTKEDLGYIAGLFDGEGDCRIQAYKASKNGKYYLRLVARITNTNKQCLDFVKNTLGFGGVTISGRRSKQDRGWKDSYCFWATNKTAKEFLQLIRPSLIIKAKLVDAILNCQNTGPKPEGFKSPCSKDFFDAN